MTMMTPTPMITFSPLSVSREASRRSPTGSVHGAAALRVATQLGEATLPGLPGSAAAPSAPNAGLAAIGLVQLGPVVSPTMCQVRPLCRNEVRRWPPSAAAIKALGSCT